MTTKSSFLKGIEFEKEFAQYLKKELEYEKTKTRSQILAKMNKRGTNIDIIGERQTLTGKRFTLAFKLYFALFGLLFLIGVYYQVVGNYNQANLYLTPSILFEVAGAVALVISRIYNKENVWVECKNLKGKANINQMRKLIAEIEDYKKSNDKTYRFNRFIFASKNGFIENALSLANEHDIECFSKTKSGQFELVNEWN